MSALQEQVQLKRKSTLYIYSYDLEHSTGDM